MQRVEMPFRFIAVAADSIAAQFMWEFFFFFSSIPTCFISFKSCVFFGFLIDRNDNHKTQDNCYLTATQQCEKTRETEEGTGKTVRKFCEQQTTCSMGRREHATKINTHTDRTKRSDTRSDNAHITSLWNHRRCQPHFRTEFSPERFTE